MQHCSLSFFFYLLCTCLCHSFSLSLSLSFYFLSIRHSFFLSHPMCIRNVYACMYMKCMKFFLAFSFLSFAFFPFSFLSLSLSRSLSHTLSLSLFLLLSLTLSPSHSLTVLLLLGNGENSKFPSVLLRGEPLVRPASWLITFTWMCCEVSLVSVSWSPRSVSFFVFPLFKIDSWWSGLMESLEFCAISLLWVIGDDDRGEGWILDLRSEQLRNRNRSRLIVKIIRTDYWYVRNEMWNV